MTKLDGISVSERSIRVARAVAGILWLVLLAGLWAYVWVH